MEAFVVNDTLAAQMGIEVPAGAWTWADFKAIGEQILAYNKENGTNYYLFHDNLNAPYIQDQYDKIKPEARNVTINEMFELWKQIKRGLKDNTFQNYQFMYNQYIAPRFGKQKISTLVKSDVKRFYNTLADERGLSIATIDVVHTVLHQVLEMAVDDCYIRRNPSDNVLKELKQAVAMKNEKRRALTKQEQNLLLDYLHRSPQYRHWYIE